MNSSSDMTASAAPQVKLAEYRDYAEAQAAVDHLADEGFPVRTVSIVWSRLRRIEYVTGRRSWLTAARDGALSGIWFGAFLGLLLTLFAELDEGTSTIGVIVSYAAVGAAVGAAFLALQHLSTRGKRDFTTSGRLDAEAYEIWVAAEVAARARTMLGVATTRPTDPEPDDPPDPT